MAIKKYAGLDTNYLPTDGSVPVALGDEAIELTVTSGTVSQAVSLEGYDKIAFVTEGGTNTSIDFLELIGSETTDATLEIVKDISASSGYALKLTGTQKLVFGTRISYVPDILKKVTLKAKKDTGNTGNLYASVVSYANGQYINKSGNISIEDYVSVVDTSSLTTSYTTNIGYIKGTGTNYVEPANNPNSPSELPTTTDEIALVLESTGASDIWYIDVISLEEVENSIRDIPDGEGVYSSSQNFNTRNDRITTTPANPVVTTPTTYTLNGDGSIDITFTWTYTGSGDAYNIDGFSIYTHSSDTSTPPTFSDSAVYVDATTRKFTLYGITINKYYTVGVQAYRQIDHDIAVDLSLSEDVIRSSIVQSTPYRPVNITPSTTSYVIQRNVGSYLGSEVLGSIYIHGYYPNGMRGDIAGQILYNEGSTATDMYLAINAQAVDCTDFTYTADEEYKCYLVLNAGVVKPAIYDINTNTFVNDTETVSTGVIIGHVIVEYTHSTVTYTINDTFVYETAKLLSMSKNTKLEEAWKYLSEATSQSDWEARVDDLGIENSFTFLAAYNAFVTNLFTEDIELGGQIRANYTASGAIIDPNSEGFWLSSSGKLKAQYAELIGTLRTGVGASSDARVGIQDEVGITSGPTFTGTGLDDLSIVSDSNVAGEFSVDIAGENTGYPLPIILTSFNSAYTFSSGLTFDGTNLISCDFSSDKIYVYDGISSTILTSFNSPYTYSSGLAFDGTNLISCDLSSDKIYVHDGVSSTILSSFNSPGSTPSGLAFDGTNLISCDYTSDKIYVHDGISSTILTSFDSPGVEPFGLTFDGTNLISCDLSSDKIYVHDGVSSTILSSFNSPGVALTGLTFDGTNLISCDRDSNKIHVHATSDTFTWSIGAYTSDEIPMEAGGVYALDNGTDYGITITFGQPYGHTLNDKWEFIQSSMRGLSIRDSSGTEYFSASGGNVELNGMDMYACRAWVNFDGTGTVSIRASENVSTVTDNGTGDYTINFENDMEDVDYIMTSPSVGTASQSYGWCVSDNDSNSLFSKTISSHKVKIRNSNTAAVIDAKYIYIAWFR